MSRYGIPRESFVVKRFQPEDFIIIFSFFDDMLWILHDPPPVATFSLILKHLRRQLTASVESMCFKIQLTIHGISAHAWNHSTGRQLLPPACSHVCPFESALARVDLRVFTAEAWCVHPDLIPCERLMFILESDEVHIRGPPLFLEPKEVIHLSQPALWYRVFIDIVEVEDWQPPSESSTGLDSDSSADGILGSRVSGFSHPWPKRIRLPASEGGGPDSE
jgi:hypothetical protein